MDFPDDLPPELHGELEMLEAMYSDALTVSQTDLENLHRIRSDEIISYSSRQTSNSNSTMMMMTASSSSNIMSPISPNKNEGRVIVKLKLRKNVEIELTFPSSGYYVDDNSKIKMRIDVLNTPHGIDSESLLQEMKQVQQSHTIGEGSLIISICQAAEEFVESALTTNNVGSPASSSSDGENNTGQEGEEELEDIATLIARQQQQQNQHHQDNDSSSTSNNNNASVVHAGSEAEIWQELQKRGCIRGSNVIHDRKSKFLAHAAPISSEKEAKEIVSLLREMKSIAVACHPSIWAYKFQNPSTKVVHYDCDDDGEKNGEKNIQFVLENLKVSGWIVVVTRYFGGILLGPERFRHIASVTRDVLIEAGAASDGSSSGTNGKKK